jgi:hypothetical protein
MNRPTPIRAGLAAAGAAGAVLFPLAACQAGGPTVAVGAATATDQPTSAAAASTGTVGKGTGGPGSLTVAITSPVAVSGHVDTEVSCQATGARYTASASGTLHGYTVADVVRVVGYHGPGSYPALVTVSVTGASARDAITAVPATAQITAAGGDVSFSATTDAGRTLAGSIAWACSA